jgi:hypothetical protein
VVTLFDEQQGPGYVPQGGCGLLPRNWGEVMTGYVWERPVSEGQVIRPSEMIAIGDTCLGGDPVVFPLTADVPDATSESYWSAVGPGYHYAGDYQLGLCDTVLSWGALYLAGAPLMAGSRPEGPGPCPRRT